MTTRQLLRIQINGAVQGVGFRPFVYRQATKLKLAGQVQNTPQGVFIEAEGPRLSLEAFLQCIQQEKPPLAIIQHLESTYLDPVGFDDFKINHSNSVGGKTAYILPDTATCPDCLEDILNPTNRRYRYPFANCTNCGPRYTIINALPYDRPDTTMSGFEMCPECRAEYENPLDRRFHAQPNACPNCGPHIELCDHAGKPLATHENALSAAAEAIRNGAIIAVKGLGGFHLMVDARNQDAVQRLRERKHREEKPFALMYPSLELVKAHCEVSCLEETLLTSPQSPIVLLRHRYSPVTSAVAPGNPYHGIMLPYTPLHHLLMTELGFPVIATSGNHSDEPICIDEAVVVQQLAGIADMFLVHNRPIARPVDDSIVRVIAGREMVLRRARGYTPLPVQIHPPQDAVPLLATGAHLKNTVAMAAGEDVFISQHIGDLDTAATFETFKQTITGFEQLYDFHAEIIVHDLHSDYLSSQFAESSGLPAMSVQHHYAHALACMADNQIEPPVLGIVWDGTGYGPDGTIWGGEFLLIGADTFERIAHLHTFHLPGGEQAIHEPSRTAIGLLYEVFGDRLFDMESLAPIQAFSSAHLNTIKTMLKKNINTPVTSSAGRLFDGVAALLGLRQHSSFEGQAAMDLEFAMQELQTEASYPFTIDGGVIDWRPMLASIVEDLSRNITPAEIAVSFHNTLVEMIVETAKRTAIAQVALTGGCFQNQYLTERAVEYLSNAGFTPHWHRQVPPNDGGISLGQIIACKRK